MCMGAAFGKLMRATVEQAEARNEVDGAELENRLCVYDRRNAIQFLVDTGANVSVIPRTKVKTLCNNVAYKLYAANGSEIRTYGTVTLELNLRLRRAFKWTFIIADVNRPILGADFLKHYSLVVDIGNKRIVDGITNLCAAGLLTNCREASVSTFDRRNVCSDIFAKYPNVTKPFNIKQETKHGVHHYIETRGAPIHSRSRPLPPDRYNLVREEFRKMQELGICRPSKSEWASPLHVVPKKDGQLRPCGDYRQLNAMTKPDRYPIPRMQDFTYGLAGKTIFTHIDANKAFHNISVNPADVEKTAIITPFGLFEFPKMTFGLCGAAQTYQRFMNDVVLKGIEQINCETSKEKKGKSQLFCYIDDVIIASCCDSCHKKHLDLLFSRYDECGITINLAKCEFGQKQVEFLGYNVSSEGIKPLEEKVEAISKFPRPETIEQLRRFLGMINFYRSHLPHAVMLQQELNKLLHGAKKRDKTRIEWTTETNEAFEKCRVSLKNAVTLTHPLEGVPLALMTDASDSCVGGVVQQWDGKAWRPLGFYSKKLSDTQVKYSTYDRELLAIFMSVQHFRNMIEGRQLIIFTDHKPLTFAFTKQTDSGKEVARRVRQLSYISEFSTDIRHVKGDLNIVADTLSRVATIECPALFDFAQLAEAQERDSQVTLLVSRTSDKSNYELKQCSIPNSIKKIFCEVSTDNIRPYIPESLRKRVFDAIHGISHPGIRTTRKMVAKRYFWPGMNKDVGIWAKTCNACQRAKVGRHNSSEIGHYENSGRFEHLHVDIVGPLPTTQEGYRYLVTVVDRFTRWPEAFPVETITAEVVAKVLYEGWICRFGSPKRITTDQGRQFESELFNKLMQLLGVCRIRTTPYHPESNGMVERWHRSLKAALMTKMTDGSWSDELQTVMLGLRTAIRSDSGISAAELVYGQTITLPGEFYLQESQNRMDGHEYLEKLRRVISRNQPAPRYHSSARNIFVHPDLDTSEYVFIRNDAVRKPLQPPYDGPFKVVKRTGKYYSVQLPNRRTQVSVDRLKPAYLLKEEDDTYSEGQTDLRTVTSGRPTHTNSDSIPVTSPAVENRTRSGRVVRRPVRFM